MVDGISYIPSTVILTGIQKVSLKDNRLFAVLDTKGECPRGFRAELGFYYSDTRYLRNWDMLVNGETLVRLSHGIRAQGNAAVFSMTNRDIRELDGSGRIPRDALLIRRLLTLYRDTIYEQLEFTNYDTVAHDLRITQRAESEFEDIFEVRGVHRKQRGKLEGVHPLGHGREGLVFEYRGLDGLTRRTFLVPMSPGPQPRAAGPGAEIDYRITVPAKGRTDLKTIVSFEKPPDGVLGGDRFADMTVSEHLLKMDAFSRRSFLGELRISSDNPIFDRCLHNSRLDIETLTTFEPDLEIVYPYAGLPWFSAPFGRDALITAYQSLPWFPNLAVGVLDYAFRTLGSKLDPFTEEAPGKVFHELRRGEMANLREIPYIPYYGSIDSTPLALILLTEYVAWSRDMARLRGWWPQARRALEWIREKSRANADGFLDYKKSGAAGLDNQGWKDSHNSIMHENGRLAEPPIAVCEAQAYSYRARRGMADLAMLLGKGELAAELRQEAERLRARFHELFWDEKDKYAYLALDGHRRPCRVMSSNQGHCLWGQILGEQEADSVGRHLLSPRLFSGYGVRTLASDELAYNPLSYHNGSVWPHDNSLIAEGLRFYRLNPQLQALADGLFDVAATTADFRLPELYCGFRRRGVEPPVPYEVACKPQAWAAGSVFLLTKSLAGFLMTPHQESIIFHSPMLPSRVSSLEIRDLTVRDMEFSAIIYRGQNTCHLEITRKTGRMQVVVIK